MPDHRETGRPQTIEGDGMNSAGQNHAPYSIIPEEAVCSEAEGAAHAESFPFCDYANSMQPVYPGECADHVP